MAGKPIEITKAELLDLIKEVGEGGWTLYSVLASLTVDGICELRQTDLSDALNVSKKSIYNRVNKLAGTQVKGEPLLKAIRKHGSHIYVVTPISMEGLFHTTSMDGRNLSVEDLQGRLDNRHPLSTVKGVIAYWSASYLNTYGTTYKTSSWAKESGLISKKLLANFKPEKLQAIIDVVMRLYATKWMTSDFPRPTIGQLASWLAQQAEPYATANMQLQLTIITAGPDCEDVLKQMDQW